MKRPSAIALVAVFGVVIAPVSAAAATTASTTSMSSAPVATAPADRAMVRLATPAPRVPAGATRLGRLATSEPLTITVALRPTHTAQLDALLHDLYDPKSPRYQQWLPTGAFARDFGPSPAQTRAVTSWLHAQGLTDTTVQGMDITATADAGHVAGAFGVSFSRYRLAGGTTGYVASNAPLLPRDVADSITTIVGLSDTVRFDNALDPTPRPRTTALAAAATPAAAPVAAPSAVANAAPKACAAASKFAGTLYWTPDQVGGFYHVNDLFAAGLTGKGKTIALLELAQSQAANTNHYLSCFGLHNTVGVVHVDGGATFDSGGTLEVEIDIQEAATQAPGASILSYEAPNTAEGEIDAYSKIVNDNKAQVVSTSWGKCESGLVAEPGGTAFLASLHSILQQAAAQGQSVFAATGDAGSEDCYDPSDGISDESLQVDNPADDPFVTAVGGTSLEKPGVEPVWNDCGGMSGDSCAQGGQDAGGGGESGQYARPSWERVASNATCATCRAVPDISANAGVGETFFNAGTWTPVGGTSIAAPLFAGIAADIDQGIKGGKLGDFAPKLNALANLRVYGSALTDVTTGVNWNTFTIVPFGGNDLTRTHGGTFKTATGFDLATGFGVPIASGLAAPQITSMTPNHGKAGTHITLHGVGLERATIKFGSKIAKVVSAGPKSAVVIVPAGKGTVSVSGSDPIGTGSKPASFSYPGVDAGAYRTVAANGSVFNFGDAHGYGNPNAATLHSPIVSMALDHATGGYWLVAADGNVYNYNAPFYGSAGSHPLNQPIVGMAATKNGDGYLLVARDGGIFAYGKARFRGSTGGIHLNQPIVGITVDPKTGGYWLVASDGGIFAFDAPFYGSTGAMHLNQPIVGIAADGATGGYWLVASDGGVFAFNAPFYGSTGALDLNQPIVGIAATDDARGYRFVAADGGVFNFGDARFSGSTGDMGLAQPVVALAPGH